MRMKPILWTLGIAAVGVIAFVGLRATILAPAEFRAQSQPAPACPDPMFDKSAVVFDVLTICGTSGVPMDKLAHAANVGARWLDNDADGDLDEPSVGAALAANKATVIMSGKGFSSIAMTRVMLKMEQEGRFGQDLYANETGNPERRDASQEELHHIIIGAGWAQAYADVFDDKSTQSIIHQAWTVADANKYYVYHDPTCDVTCKVMEFTYKATAAYLGSDADLADEEFTIKTRDLLAREIPAITGAFEDERYAYPLTAWPDGTYDHSQNITYFP